MNNQWIQTFTGTTVYPLAIQQFSINIEDIAHALSNMCRFTGHTREFYSVAEHSIRVSELVPKELKLAALLHDGSEAYLSDIASPVKNHPDFSFYRDAELDVQTAIYQSFGIYLDFSKHSIIRRADIILLVTEKRDLMTKGEREWELPDIKPLDKTIVPLSPSSAKQLFIEKFNEYDKWKK